MKSDIKKLNILVDRSIHLKTKESRILKKYYQAEEDVKNGHPAAAAVLLKLRLQKCRDRIKSNEIEAKKKKKNIK